MMSRPPSRAQFLPNDEDNEGEGNLSGRGEHKPGSVLEVMHSSYTPHDIILRIIDETDNNRVVFYRTLPIHVARYEPILSSILLINYRNYLPIHNPHISTHPIHPSS